MKILFVSHSAGVAGAERSLVRLVEEAVVRGHTGWVTIPEHGPIEDSLSPRFDVLLIRNRQWAGRRQLFPFGIPRLLGTFLDGRRFYKALNSLRPDVVVVNVSTTPAPLVAAKALGIPSVLIVRESLMSNPNLRGVLPRRLRRRLLARWATKVLVISEYVRSQFIRDSEVIWPPADLARAICKGTDDPGATIALIGSVSAEKGQLDFVEVAERVVAALPGVKFEMWGSGASDSLRRLKRRIRRSPAKNNILYGGETNDAMGVMSRSILTVSCSRNEGFGKTTLESIAVGTPVVGYDAGGTREILADGGGCLVEANPEAMAAKIVLLLRSPEKMRSLRETCEDHPAIAKGLSAASDAIEAIEDLASSRRE